MLDILVLHYKNAKGHTALCNHSNSINKIKGLLKNVKTTLENFFRGLNIIQNTPPKTIGKCDLMNNVSPLDMSSIDAMEKSMGL